MKDRTDQEKFKEILFSAYKRGNEEVDLKLSILVEEIKKQFEKHK